MNAGGFSIAVDGRALDEALVWVTRALPDRLSACNVVGGCVDNNWLYVSATDGQRLYRERIPYRGSGSGMFALRRVDVALLRAVAQSAVGDVSLRAKANRLRAASHCAALWLTVVSDNLPSVLAAPVPSFGNAAVVTVNVTAQRAVCREALRVSKTAWVTIDGLPEGYKIPAQYLLDGLPSANTKRRMPCWAYVTEDGVFVLKTLRRDVCFRVRVPEVADERATNA